MKSKKVGFTIGKFAPLHKGHQYLIETALKEMDRFVIVIYETDLTKIDIDVRANWLRKLYPEAEIRYALNAPKQYGLDNESVQIQMKYLMNIIKDLKPTHFYSSEPYGESVANYLGIIDRRVDTERKKVPINSTKIRNNVKENKKWLDNIVYNDIKKELCI